MLEKPRRWFCAVHQIITLHIVQYSYSLMTGSATVTTRLYFRSIHKFCSRTDRWYDRSPIHMAVTMNTVVTERYSNKLVTIA